MKIASWAAFLVAFALYPVVWDSPFMHSLGVLVVVNALAATGWNMLGGLAGQISLGHAAFFGAGAYAMALGGRNGINPWISMLLGALAVIPIALAIGLPVFRLRGHYFTIATIAMSEVAFLIVLNRQAWGGATGLSIRIQPDSLAELQWSGRQKWEYYYLGCALLIAALIATSIVLRSKLGFYLKSIRGNQDAAASLGVWVAGYKQLAFVLSAVTVSVAGSFFAQYVLFVDPDSTLSLTISIEITIVAVLGGVLSMWGPVIGAATFVFLNHWSRISFGGEGDALNLVIYGTIVMVIAAFEPNGLIGLGARLRRLVGRARS